MHIISTAAYKGETPLQISFFNVAELHEKLKIDFSDILLVTTDETESRNKLVWLKDEVREYTLMNVPFAALLEHTDNLVMVNKGTLISIGAVHWFGYDFITLKNLFPGWNNKQVTLGRNYREDFYSKVGKQKNGKRY